MIGYNKENIFKSVIVVVRKDDVPSAQLNSPKSQEIKLGSPEKPKSEEKNMTSTPLKFEAKEETVEIVKESPALSGKGEVINITNFIEVEKSGSIDVEQTTKIDPFKSSSEVKPQKV